MATSSKVDPTEPAPGIEIDAPVTATEPVAAQHGGFITWAARTFSSLSNREFRLLWFGMLLSMGGFQMQMIARGILVYDLTNNAVLTSVVAMGFAPSLLLVSLFGGVLGDRMERRLLIQIGQAVNAVAAGVVAVLVITGSVHWTHLFAVSIVQGAMFAVQMPARQAAIPKLVGKERVGNAVALNAMAMSLMNVAAPGIGGVIYGLGGPEAAYLTVTGMMIAAVLLTGLIPRMYPSGDAARQSVLENIKGGFAYALGNRIVRVMLIYSVMLALLSMPFRMLLPVFAKDLYGVSPEGVGVLATMVGVGGLAASLLSASLRKGQHRGLVLLSAGVISGASLFFIASLPFYLVGAILMIGIGFGETIRWGLGQALIMEETDDQYRSRMMSLLMMSFGLMPVAVLPLGFAVEHFGASTAALGMSVVLLVASVIFIFGNARLRKME
ncbi:MAG: MFS transporter [Chloroflexi bacterium]|nr:MFS transporter [Chloroflexota bacterium]